MFPELGTCAVLADMRLATQNFVELEDAHGGDDMLATDNIVATEDALELEHNGGDDGMDEASKTTLILTLKLLRILMTMMIF